MVWAFTPKMNPSRLLWFFTPNPPKKYVYGLDINHQYESKLSTCGILKPCGIISEQLK